MPRYFVVSSRAKEVGRSISGYEAVSGFSSTVVSLIASHEGGESCVCDISPAFDLSQPTISHHLKVLREAGLLDCERRGTWVYYRVIPSALAQLSAVLSPERGVVQGSDCAVVDDAAEATR